MGYRPHNRIVTYAAPSGHVVSVEDLRRHLRVDDNTEELGIIEDVEAAAVAAVERHVQKLLLPRQVILSLPGLPNNRAPVELPGGPVQTLTSVEADGDAITGATAIGHSPALLVPGADWPVVVGEGYPVTITYTAGLSTVPADLVAAVKLWASHLFEHRQAVVLDGTPKELPMGVTALLGPNRIRPA